MIRRPPLPGQTLPVVALILAVGGLSSWQLQHHLSAQLMQQALLAQKLQVEADVAQFDATLAEAEQSIEQFAELVSSIDPAGSQVVEAATAFNQLVQRDRPAARDWLISVVAPFHQGGRWAGAVGHDLLLRDLLRWLMPLDRPARGGCRPSLFMWWPAMGVCWYGESAARDPRLVYPSFISGCCSPCPRLSGCSASIWETTI